MSTSLADQLQRLALPQTSILKHSKKRASLLFDPTEAAGLKRETVYQIGLEGLEELIEKNANFEQFTNTLFSMNSKDFERSVQTSEVNSKLNKNIKKFLLLISPYFMLNCTHKSLEWLVNRFAIHEYNREDILKLILPYHESNVFVRMLQLLKFKDAKDSFYFLKELQRPGVHLSKQSLLNHAAGNSGFLKFVTEYIMQLLKVHDKAHLLTTAFNFYCAVFTGALEYSENIKEDQVTQILPLLLKGLNSPIPDFCAASYIILARLVSKSSLSDRLLDKFLEKLSDLKVQNLKTEAVLVTVVLYQSQKLYRNMPPQVVASFSEKEWLPKVLQELNESGSYIYSFLEVLIKRNAEEGVNNDLNLSRTLIQNCLDVIKLDDFFISIFVHNILDTLKPKTKYSSEAINWIIEIMQTLERQYPAAFDKEVYRILSTAVDKKSLKRKKCLSKILKNTMVYKGKYAIIDKLYHPNAEIRGTAVKYLKENYKTLRDTDREIIKSSFVERLNDENLKVVEETLSVVKKVDIVEKNDLRNGLINLLDKCKRLGKDWEVVALRVLNLLIDTSDPNDWEVFIAIFPYLLPNSEEEYKACKKLLKKEYFIKHPIFESSIAKLQSSHDHNDFTKVFLKLLQNCNNLDLIKQFLHVLSKVPKDKRTVYHKYVSFLIMSSLLPKNSTLEIGAEILEVLKAYAEGFANIFNKEGTVTQYIEATIKFQHPIFGYLKCIQNVIKKIQKPQWKPSVRDFFLENTQNNFFLYLTHLLFNGKITSEKYTTYYLDYFCENLQEKANFLLNLCTSQNKIFDANFVPSVLDFLTTILREKNEEVKQFIYIDQITPILLLILLYHSENTIRSKVFVLIDFFTEISTRKSTSYYYIFEGLKKYREEIMLDHEQIPLVMFNILDPTNTKGKKHSTDFSLIRNHMLKIISGEEYPVYIKSGILKLMSFINTSDMFEEISKIALKILDTKPNVIESFEAQFVSCTLNRIDNIMKNMKLDCHSWKLLETCIRNDKTQIIIEGETSITPAPLLLNNLNKETFSVLDKDLHAQLLNLIIETASTAQNPEVYPSASKIFKHIDLDALLVLEHLKLMKEIQSPELDVTKRRSRGSIIPTVDILDTIEWRKGVTVLEFIQDKKKIRNFSCLLPVLFDILKKCLDFYEQVPVEYVKQLVLSSILHCCTKSDDDLPENVFNMELIVQCIRVSQNPQTHHHALLVLAHTAQLIPSQVLHHMMTIFTFMGSSVLRHDDAYSFQIITKIINTIIPILVQDNQESNIAKVLRVFVDVLLDVPEHRRMPLYEQLLEKIDAKENLYLFLLLVCESQVMASSNQKQPKETNQKRLDIASNLCRTFSPHIVIYTCIKLMKYVQQLPNEKEDDMAVDTECIIAIQSPKDFRHLKYLLVKFIANILGSREFVNQVAQLEEQAELDLEGLFKEMVINTLQYIQRVSKIVDKNPSAPQAQYWKVIVNLSHDVLDSINALVTPQMFLLVTKGLMVHNLSTVRRRIIELLNNKLQYEPQFFRDCDKNEIYSLIPSLVSIIEKLNDDVEHEQEIIIQTALLSLKLLIKSFAQENPSKFVPILEFITKVIKSGKAQSNVLASSVLCLAELCISLRAHALSSLPYFMPALIKILKQQKREETPSVLLKSIITAIEKVLDSLPLFLSPYLQKLLTELCLLIAKWNFDASGESKSQPFALKIAGIKQKIGLVIPLRVLLPYVDESYTCLVEKKAYIAIGELSDILGENLTNLTDLDISNNLTDLTNFFLNALKFRTECESTPDADYVEGHIIKAFTIVVLKLSESGFRPIYYKIYDWAIRSEIKSERLITFYNLSSILAQSLKGLFILFAGHFLNNAAQTLDACNNVKSTDLYFEDETKNLVLLENILKTFDAVFLYDTQKFVNKDRFEVLMQPLVDQLENTLGGLDSLEKRNKDILTPCMVHFSLATADDALWKQMNYQILLKLRHNEPKIRLVTLYCLTNIVKKLGEDYLPLLPETIPFLGELLEDEDEEVEKASQKAVQEMEKVLGEPLQKYF